MPVGQGDGLSADYVIVGGGSAGCVLAARLSEDPDVSVLLVEAGGSDRHPLFSIPAGFAKMTKGVASWGWHTVPQRHLGGRVLRFTQAKVIGGGSSINAQIYTRGNRADYDGWATVHGCAGWDYESVLPYFKRSEDNQRLVDRYHGYGGPLGVSMPAAALPVCDAFLRAAQEFGMPFNGDFNGERQEGAGYYQLTQRDRKRSSAYRAFLAPLGRRNLVIRTGLDVTRIVIDKGRATGIEARSGSATISIHAAREVIVASGAIGSPRLLMLSGIGPADHLAALGLKVEADLPSVGENLQDHLDLFAIAECTGNHSHDSVARLDRTIIAGLQYILFKSGPAASSLFETGGFWFAGKDETAPDIQFHLGLGSGIEAGVARLKNPGITLNSAFLRPRSRGSVRLASADPAAAPLIDPNYWEDPVDRDRSLEGLRMAREILAQPALRPFILAERLPGPDISTRAALEAYAHAHAKTDHHPVGTCRMGPDDASVVDLDLRVRGIAGLRVCDSSIMPTVPSSNTNAPTIMVAEKGADIIAGRSARSAA